MGAKVSALSLPLRVQVDISGLAVGMWGQSWEALKGGASM